MADKSTYRRVSYQQLECLYEFLKKYPEVAKSYSRNLRGKDFNRRKWMEVSTILNAQGDGSHKDWRGWCKYWTDYKSKIKAKVAALRAAHARTGGGPSVTKDLSETEAKFLQILGNDFGQGLPGIQVQLDLEEPTQLSSITPEATVYNFEIEVEGTESSLLLDTEVGQTEPALLLNNEAERPESFSISNNVVDSVTTPPNSNVSGRQQQRRVHLSQESARRALVSSSQQRADAAVNSAEALEKIAITLVEMQSSLKNCERILAAAFSAVDPNNFD